MGCLEKEKSKATLFFKWGKLYTTPPPLIIVRFLRFRKNKRSHTILNLRVVGCEIVPTKHLLLKKLTNFSMSWICLLTCDMMLCFAWRGLISLAIVLSMYFLMSSERNGSYVLWIRSILPHQMIIRSAIILSEWQYKRHKGDAILTRNNKSYVQTTLLPYSILFSSWF